MIGRSARRALLLPLLVLGASAVVDAAPAMAADTIPPAVGITDGPVQGGTTGAQAPSITWWAEAGATTSCTFDGYATACVSPLEIGALEDGPRRRADRGAELVGNHIGECCLAEAGRTIQKHVVERLATAGRSGNRDLQVGADPVLPDVVIQPARAQPRLVLDIVVGARGGDEAV